MTIQIDGNLAMADHILYAGPHDYEPMEPTQIRNKTANWLHA